jgi:chemotaxis response regulator CheB
MNDKVNPESLGQARPAFDTRKYVRHIVNSGMPEAQADALIDLLNASFENVVTDDDLKPALDGLEAAVKSYADKLSKDDRKFLIRFTTKLVNQLRTDVNQLRTDMNSRFDGVDKRFGNVFEELANARKENKEIRKEVAAAEQRRQEQQAESDRRKDKRTRDNRRFAVLLVGVVTGLAAAIIAVLEYLS